MCHTVTPTCEQVSSPERANPSEAGMSQEDWPFPLPTAKVPALLASLTGVLASGRCPGGSQGGSREGSVLSTKHPHGLPVSSHCKTSQEPFESPEADSTRKPREVADQRLWASTSSSEGHAAQLSGVSTPHRHTLVQPSQQPRGAAWEYPHYAGKETEAPQVTWLTQDQVHSWEEPELGSDSSASRTCPKVRLTALRTDALEAGPGNDVVLMEVPSLCWQVLCAPLGMPDFTRSLHFPDDPGTSEQVSVSSGTRLWAAEALL